MQMLQVMIVHFVKMGITKKQILLILRRRVLVKGERNIYLLKS